MSSYIFCDVEAILFSNHFALFNSSKIVDFSFIKFKTFFVNSVDLLLGNKKEYDKMAKAVNPYGDGNTSKMIHNYFLNA